MFTNNCDGRQFILFADSKIHMHLHIHIHTYELTNITYVQTLTELGEILFKNIWENIRILKKNII